MSQYLPEGFQPAKTAVQSTADQAPDVSSGLAKILGSDQDVGALIKSLFGDPNRLFREAPQFFSYLTSWIEQSGLQIPISQVFGFAQFTSQPDTVLTSETTSSTTYTDLATVGPQLTGLPDGQFVLLFGATINSGAGGAQYMSIQVNSDAVSDNDAAIAGALQETSPARAVTKTLSGNGNNTITAKYKSTVTDTGTFKRRWLLALRYANA